MKNDKTHSNFLDDSIRIVANQDLKINKLKNQDQVLSNKLDSAISSSENLIKSLGYDLPQKQDRGNIHIVEPIKTIVAPSWEEMLIEAKQAIPEQPKVTSLLTPEQIKKVLGKHEDLCKYADSLSSLSWFEIAFSIVTGLVSGIIDCLWVGLPKNSGFLGSLPSEGGELSNWVKQKFSEVIPEENIKKLENIYKVPFDITNKNTLLKPIDGLGPNTHRFQSLGHDPVLGFTLGVRDIIYGEMTALSKNGEIIVQSTGSELLPGENLFVRIIEAMRLWFGHLESDVATSAGLPAPLTPLLMFLQFGKIGKHDYTIGEVARIAYRSGYDFRHFVACSLPVGFTEISVRVAYAIGSLVDGKKLSDSIPLASIPKLRRMLLLAHGTAGLINAGKVYITHNLLALNWAQLIALLRYIIPEISFLLEGKEKERQKIVNDNIMKEYNELLLSIGNNVKTSNLKIVL